MEKFADERLYRLTNHICRACMGRLLMTETFDHKKTWLCSNCSLEREGPLHTALCMCGMKLRTRIDAGVRCMINDQKTAECPSTIVAREVTALMREAENSA